MTSAPTAFSQPKICDACETVAHCTAHGCIPAREATSSPTAGMNMAQRILHVGGRNPPGSTYVEFGSIQAVEALVAQVLRDRKPRPDAVYFPRKNANDYCRILSILGMDEEGDPVAEVQRLQAAAPQAPTLPRRWISDQVGGEFDDMTSGQGYRKGWNDCRAAMLAANPGAKEPRP